jgi:hypothetical protein
MASQDVGSIWLAIDGSTRSFALHTSLVATSELDAA